MVSTNRNWMVFSVLMCLVGAVGCQAVGGSPFAFRSRPPAVVASDATADSSAALMTNNPPQATVDSSHKIAAESRALSGQFSATPTPELAKYAASPGADRSVEASSAGRGGSFSSGMTSGGSSSCPNGCRH